MDETIVEPNNDVSSQSNWDMVLCELIKQEEKETPLTQSEVDLIVKNFPIKPASRFMRFFGTFLSNLIGNIPFIGPFAGALFSTMWDEMFTVDESGAPGMPPQPRFLTPEEFNRYVSEFRADMENLLNERIDDFILNSSTAHLLNVKNACDRWHEVISWYEEEHGQGRHRASIPRENMASFLNKPLVQSAHTLKPMSLNQIRQLIRDRHHIAITEMNRCLTFYTTVVTSENQRRIIAGHVIQTCMFFILIQRDVFFKGRDWGFLPQIIALIPNDIESFIDRSFGNFAIFAAPVMDRNNLSPNNTPDLYNIYSTFAYLDLVRFPITGANLNIERLTNSVTIPQKYHDNRLRIVVNQMGALRDGEIHPPFWPDGFMMEGVYHVDNFQARNLMYQIRRPTNPFTLVTIRVSVTGPNINSRIIVDNVLRPTSRSQCKDMHHYLGRATNYLSVTIAFPSPTISFWLRVENINVNQFSNHSLFEFS